MQAELADMMIKKCLLNYHGNNVNVTGVLVTWLEAFDTVDDAIMQDAFKLTIKRCKFFPTVADIQESVDTVKQQKRTFDNAPKLDRAKNYDSPMAAKVFETISKMDTAKFVADMTVEPEIVNFARLKFPNISERLIKENYLEILYALEGSDKCFGCKWHDGKCDTNGFFPTMELLASGRVNVTMTMCGKNRISA